MNEEEFKEMFESKTAGGFDVRFLEYNEGPLEYRYGAIHHIVASVKDNTEFAEGGWVLISYTDDGIPALKDKDDYMLVKKKKPWPRFGSIYYDVAPDGKVVAELVSCVEHAERLRVLGRVREIEEEAKRERDKQFATVRVLEKMKEFMEGREFEWSNINTIQYFITFDCCQDKFVFDTTYVYRCLPESHYTTQTGCEWIIENMEDDLKLMFDVEN